MYQQTAHSQVFRIAIMASSIVGLLACPISAQVTLYDNLDNVRSDGSSEVDWLTPAGPNQRFAQQFFLGEQTNIDQVTVSLLRPQPGATGSLRFELWRDNGSGQPVPVDDPTGKIADLGKVVDVTQIPAGTFGEYTFDNLILGLEPNMPYWIVTDHEEVRGSGDGGVGFATVFSGDSMILDPPGYDATAGTFGAAHIHAYRERNPLDPTWSDLNNFFGLEHFYQAMKVEAMEERPTGWSHNFDAGIPETVEFRIPAGPNQSSQTWSAAVEDGHLTISESRSINSGGAALLAGIDTSQTFSDVRVVGTVNVDPNIGTFLGLAANDTGPDAYLFGIETAPGADVGTAWLSQCNPDSCVQWGSHRDFGIETRLDTSRSYYLEFDVVGNELTGRVFDERGGNELISISREVENPIADPGRAGVYSSTAVGFDHVPTGGTFDNVSAVSLKHNLSLYDNLEFPIVEGDLGPRFDHRNEKIAQNFTSTDANNLSSVDLRLQRVGSPSGEVAVEVWSDDGSGKPGSLISTVGTFGVSSLSTTGELLSFDALVTGIEPNSSYFVVLNNEATNISSANNSYRFGVRGQVDDEQAEGTNGANRVLSTDPSGDWRFIQVTLGCNPANGHCAHYQQMAIGSESLLGDFNRNGKLDAVDMDMLSSQVRRMPDDRKFDLNNDATLTSADRDTWVHNLANTSFGDANLDGEFNSADMNFVFAAREYEDNITLNSTWAEGDWNGDGDFDSADLALANTLMGDANLDGTVTFPDFLALSAGFGSEGGWAEGDFDGSGDVAFPDFLALSANFGQSANAIAPVPEPSSLTLFCVGLVAIKRRRRRLG